MIRFLFHLFKLPGYESCKSCETLRQQLAIANEEKKQLTETLLSLVKPQVFEQPPVELGNFKQAPGMVTFSRRRAELEKAAKIRDNITANSTFIAKPSVKSVEELEEELGVQEVNNG